MNKLTELMNRIYTLASDTNTQPENAYTKIASYLASLPKDEESLKEEALIRLVIILARRGRFKEVHRCKQ